ncbi:MAG: DNA internalization-related competence protein ComEC/Rec2 [Gammaproteobacteria bacterium]
MLLNAVCFLLGILLCLQLQAILPMFILLAMPVCCWLLYRSTVLKCLAFCLLGVLWTTFSAHQAQRQQLAPELEGQTLQLCGHVSSLPLQKTRSTRFEFAVTRAMFGETVIRPFPESVRLNWYHNKQVIRAGQGWCLYVRLKRPFSMLNPGGFDYETWLFQRGIRATGYVLDKRSNRQLDTVRVWHYQHLRQVIRERLQQRQASPLMFALIIGDRSYMDRADWQLLQKTGTSHLLAISGLHIGLIAAAGFFLARWLWALLLLRFVRVPAQYVGAVVAMIAAVCYAALAGFSLPTQRALIMILTGLCALLWRRNIGVGDTFGLALFAVLLFDPFAPLAAGFWLSFLAVFIILSVTAYRSNRPGRLRAWLTIQYRISLGLSPVLLILFSQVPVFGIINNTLAIPWVSFITVPTALLATVFDLFDLAIADLFFRLCQISIELFQLCMHWFAALPYAQLTLPGLPPLLHLCAIVAAIILLLPRGLLSLWLALCFVLPVICYTPPRPAAGEVYVTVLDVGQGLAVLVETQHHTLLYDTGPAFSKTFDTGAAVIIPFLRHRGIQRLDRLVQSHGDLDHIGGLRSVLDAITVDRIDTSVPEKVSWPATHVCTAGQRWQWDGVEFTIIHPAPRSGFSGNNASCVLRVSSAAGTVLLPGDIEAPAERSLLASRPDSLAADILLAPHHGSKTSSTLRFIRAVAPRYVVFPTGYRNRFNFPKQDIIRRYQQFDSVLLNSYANGALTFRLTGSGIELQQHRQIRRRFWHTIPVP